MDGSVYRRFGLFAISVASAVFLILCISCTDEDDSPEISVSNQVSTVLSESAADSTYEATFDSILESQTMEQDAEFIDIDGVILKLSEFRGSVVMVDFWRTDTKVCVDRLDILRELRSEMHPEGFEIIGIAMNGVSKEALRRFVHRHKLPYPVVQGVSRYNPGARFKNSLPISYFYDRNGMPAGQVIGSEDKEFYERLIRHILNNT